MNDTWTYASPWTVSDGKKIVVHRRNLDVPTGRSFAYAKEECFPDPLSSGCPKETRVVAQKGALLAKDNVPPEAGTYPGGRQAFADQFAGQKYFRVEVVFRSADALARAPRIPGIRKDLEPVFGEDDAQREEKRQAWRREFNAATALNSAKNYVIAAKTVDDLTPPKFSDSLLPLGLQAFFTWRLQGFVSDWAAGKAPGRPRATVEDCRRLVLPALEHYATCAAASTAAWGDTIRTTDDYVCTTMNDCSAVASLFTGLALAGESHLRDKSDSPPVNPSAGQGIWLDFKKAIDYGWTSHFSTAFLKDGLDFLCYETAASRDIPSLPARGTGYFELYRAAENHPRRFYWLVLEKAKQNVDINADLDHLYIAGRRFGGKILTDAELTRLTAEIEEKRAKEKQALDTLGKPAQ